ncbi:hypothetical protein E2C01_047426 [Portunus trituberculatus]|uniref:Secreted protein n=1 Tax=Portunus trituberculatus TaxID=210409 RepID=A0A5B7G3J4_PORTR|nr:hypothetical protein [Portunus trituberculatus]
MFLLLLPFIGHTVTRAAQEAQAGYKECSGLVVEPMTQEPHSLHSAMDKPSAPLYRRFMCPLDLHCAGH